MVVNATRLEIILILDGIETRFYITYSQSLSKYVFRKSNACGKISTMCTILCFKNKCANGDNAVSASSSMYHNNWLTIQYWVHSRKENSNLAVSIHKYNWRRIKLKSYLVIDKPSNMVNFLEINSKAALGGNSSI